MKRIGTFLFGATFGTLVGLIAGIAGSVGLGLMSINPPSFGRHYTRVADVFPDEYGSVN